MNAQFLNDMIKQFRLRWQLSRSEIIARYAIFVGITLGLVLVCSFLGKFSAWGVNSGQYWMWSVSIFCFGAMYLAILFPGAVISISSALFGNQDKRINTRASVPEIVPKISSFFATLATGWVLFPVVIMAAIPAQNLGAFWIAAMSAGALAFLIFNRPNRGTFTLWIGCGTSGFFLATAALLNIVPTALVLWNRHVEPVTGSVSAPMVPSWIGTIFWVVLALVILAVVIRLMARLLGGVLGAASGVLNTLIKAIAAIAIVAIIVGGLGYAFYSIGSSSASAQTTSLSIPTVGDVTQVTPGKWEIKVPANQDWFPTGIHVQKGQTVSLQATGTISVLNQEDNPNPPAGFSRSQTPDGALNGGGWPGVSQDIFPVSVAPQFSLVGRIDSGEPFFVGSSKTITFSQTGSLSLGVNDNDISSNEGFWTVIITVK